MKFEIENQKGELKMKNENQKSKLSLADICKIQQEICSSISDCVSQCPFMKDGELCIVSNMDNIRNHVNEIEAICVEWEMNNPTIAEKINEILKPYGMKLMDGNHYIWFDDEDMEFRTSEFHTKDELINKLYTTKWKGEPNE
jgi:hypothetical protein